MVRNSLGKPFEAIAYTGKGLKRFRKQDRLKIALERSADEPDIGKGNTGTVPLLE